MACPFETDSSGAVTVPSGRLARGSVAAPPSKSHAIRLLVAAAVTSGPSIVAGLGDSGDVVHVTDALRRIVPVSDPVVLPDGRLEVSVLGAAASSAPSRSRPILDVGGSGTGLRFLMAVAGLATHPIEVTGDASLRARPVGTLSPALRALGVTVETRGPRGALPVVVTGPARGGGTVALDATASGQPLSALLLVGPALAGGLRIRTEGGIASRPYVDLTLAVVRRAGAQVVVRESSSRAEFEVSGPYRESRADDVAGDWSSASFLLGAAAATGGEVRVTGLEDDPVHADRHIVDVLRAFGVRIAVEGDAVVASGAVERPVDVDLGDAPDLAPLVGALGCLVDGPTRVRGAPHLRTKESDRIGAVVAAARALGFEAEEHEDGFTVIGGKRTVADGAVDPRGDHRIAMAFAAAGLGLSEVRIADPGCVAKSFPGFWDALDSLLVT